MIQEIVSRPGWSSGNSLAIIITGSGRRAAEAWNGDQAGAPLLHITYTTQSVAATGTGAPPTGEFSALLPLIAANATQSD